MISFIVVICRREFVDISKAALPRRRVRVNIVSFVFVKEIISIINCAEEGAVKNQGQ